MSTAVAGKGLEGVVAANSGICWIDGEAGILSYRGIDIHELAEHSTFEETTYLLWNGLLPNELALREFSTQLALARSLDQRVIDMLKSFPYRRHAHGGVANCGVGIELLRCRRERTTRTTPTCARPTNSPRRSPCWWPFTTEFARVRKSFLPTARSPTQATFSGC